LSYCVRRLAVVDYGDGMDGIVPALDKASAVFPHGQSSVYRCFYRSPPA
jgi:hypothetical protein